MKWRKMSTQTFESTTAISPDAPGGELKQWDRAEIPPHVMVRFDNLIRRLEAKEDEVSQLRSRLNDRVESSRQHDSTSVKAAAYIQKMEQDNRMLVKQVDLLTMEVQ